MPVHASANMVRDSRAARIRLFCIAGAGQNSSLFGPWRNHFPEEIEICPVELPGRLKRYSEPPIDKLPDLVALLNKELRPMLEIPFAFFGHSMGSLIAFELARSLRRSKLPQPIHFFASGAPAPQCFRNSTPSFSASDAYFLHQLLAMGMIQPEVAQNSALLQVVLPTLRADFRLTQTYQYRYEPQFTFPISVYYGRQESGLHGHAAAWQSFTSGSFQLLIFDGDHHFIRYQSKQITNRICQELVSAEIPIKT